MKKKIQIHFKIKEHYLAFLEGDEIEQISHHYSGSFFVVRLYKNGDEIKEMAFPSETIDNIVVTCERIKNESQPKCST